MKKIVFGLLMFLVINSVNAKNIKTYNNLEIEEKKYDALIKIYGDNFINYMTEDEYNLIKDTQLTNAYKVTYDESFSNSFIPFSSYGTDYKLISLVNNNNVITVSLKWKRNPKVRSYDIFGVRFLGVTLSSNVYFRQNYTDNGVKYDTNSVLKKFGTGFGESFLLSNKNNLESYITFSVNGTGTIFATYQHAISSISLNDSVNYTISPNGLGRVLLFNNVISKKYDQMPGVNIDV